MTGARARATRLVLVVIVLLGAAACARVQTHYKVPNLGVTDPWHVVSHHGDRPEKLANNAKVNVFCLQMFARFLEKLKNTPDGDGSLLSHSMVFYGSGMANSNIHATDPLPMVVVGGKAGRGDQHLQLAPKTQIGNLWLTVANQFGGSMNTFGESTGTVSLF